MNYHELSVCDVVAENWLGCLGLIKLSRVFGEFWS